MRLNLPTTLTLIRIFMVPLLVVVLLAPPWTAAERVEAWARDWLAATIAWRETIAVAIFLLAAATDWLDGYLARRRDEVTTLGKLLDPIADKLLTVSAFIALVELHLAPAWMVVVIVGREFAVSGMRAIAASRGLVIAASAWGKYKTVAQVVAIPLLILTNSLERWVAYGNLGKAALWVVMALAIVSMVDYFIHFVRQVDLRADD